MASFGEILEKLIKDERERVRVRVVWVCMDDDGVEKSKRLDGRCTTQ